MNLNQKLDNKYKSNNKINLYKENLIKFIIGQKNKIILIGNIEPIDYVVGILFLTESNRYFKQNKINSHGYYLAYTFINLFSKIRLKMLKSYKFNLNDISHFILSLSNNIDYFNSRIDPTNSIKNKINNNFSKFLVEIIPILTNLTEYNKIHQKNDIDTGIDTCIDTNANVDIDIVKTINTSYSSYSSVSSVSSETPIDNLFNENINNENNQINNFENVNNFAKKDLCKNLIKKTKKNKDENKFCDTECYSCWTTNVLSKFFYLLLQTAKFLGSGSYCDPNLIRLSEYYANIFYTWFKSNDLNFFKFENNKIFTELYENYLNYKNKLNYSLIELDLSSETLDEILNYIDNEIIENLSIKLK
jgi:hypothetical protein